MIDRLGKKRESLTALNISDVVSIRLGFRIEKSNLAFIRYMQLTLYSNCSFIDDMTFETFLFCVRT